MEFSQLQELSFIAQEAGQAIMDIYGRDFSSWSKDDASPLTEADLRADALIRTGLTRLFPHIPILSEESAPDLPEVASEFFLVDPLDGTKEFIKRNGEFTVNIVLIQDGHPVAGVVDASALGVQYLAGKNLGARRRDSSGETTLKPTARKPGQPQRIIGSRSHSSPEMKNWLAELKEPYEFMAAGSSLKFCCIAEGAADMYPRLGPTSQWDTAAGQCVLESVVGWTVPF